MAYFWTIEILREKGTMNKLSFQNDWFWLSHQCYISHHMFLYPTLRYIICDKGRKSGPNHEIVSELQREVNSPTQGEKQS